MDLLTLSGQRLMVGLNQGFQNRNMWTEWQYTTSTEEWGLDVKRIVCDNSCFTLLQEWVQLLQNNLLVRCEAVW